MASEPTKTETVTRMFKIMFGLFVLSFIYEYGLAPYIAIAIFLIPLPILIIWDKVVTRRRERALDKLRRA